MDSPFIVPKCSKTLAYSKSSEPNDKESLNIIFVKYNHYSTVYKYFHKLIDLAKKRIKNLNRFNIVATKLQRLRFGFAESFS